MFMLYARWDAKLYLVPDDIQFILTPDEAMARAAIYYELDYSKYMRSLPPQQVPDRKQGHHHRFSDAGYKRKPRHQYDKLYDDVEFQLEHGLMIGIDNREDWSRFNNPFYFDENSNLIYDCFMDRYSDRFKIEVRELYEYILNDHQGRKPAPTVKHHFADAPVQHAQAANTINSKAAGRLLAAGGIYNGNIEDFHKTAEQLGGDTPAGYDQVMNDQTKGSIIAAASVAAAIGLGRMSITNQISELENLHILGKVEGEFSAIKPGPLSDRFAETFSGGVYKVISLSTDTVFYRGGQNGTDLGRFFSYEKPQGIIQTRIDKAVRPKWEDGSTSVIDSYYEINIPAGTKVFVGEVGYQTDLYSGGTEQVMIPAPWDVPGIVTLDFGGLK
ncbi:hypothetical protein ACLEUK_12300 [Pseudescherichia vulneris]